MRHESGLGPGDDHRVPLTALGGMEREQLDPSGPGHAERIGVGEPAPERRPVTEGLLTQEVEHGCRHPARGHIIIAGEIGGRLQEIMGPGAQPPRRTLAGGLGDRCSQWRSRPVEADPLGDAGPVELLPQHRQLGMGPGEDRHLTAADHPWVEPSEPGDDRRCLVVGVLAADHGDGRPVRSRRRRRRRLDPGGDEDVDADVEHLRAASVVRRQPDDLDPVESFAHLGEQRRIGSVEPVDRLRRIAHEEEIVVAAPEELDDPVLERVEILRLVDEQVTVPPGDRLGERCVVLERVDGEREDIVEVDHPAFAFGGPIAVEHLGDRSQTVVGPPPTRTGGPDVGLRCDTTRRCPVDLGDEIVDAAPAGEVAHEPMAVLDDGWHGPTAVVPPLTEQPEQDGVERSGLDALAEPEWWQPSTQFSCGLPRERQHQGVAGERAPRRDAVSDASGEHPRLARTRPRDHGHQRRRGGHGAPLIGVEPLEQPIGVHLVTLGAGTVRAMSYPTKLLNDDETVAVDLHPHWMHFAEPVLALLGSIVLGVVSLFFSGGLRTALGWISILLIVGTALWTLKRYIDWATSHFVVTNQRVIYRSGWIRYRGIDIPLDRVNNVLINQGVLERLVGYGDLMIESAGQSGQQRFSDIREPGKVRNIIHAQLQASKTGTPSGPLPPPPGIDVASQLEKLEGMLERGTLTPEEFEAQKQRLLGS